MTGSTRDRLQAWRSLDTTAGRRLCAAAAEVVEPRPADLARWRREHAVEVVAAAVELAAARRRAVAKLGARAAELWADRVGVEQATGAVAARYKAERIAAAGGPVVDLCCGIGGDAVELAPRAAVLAVDHDPLRAWFCARNAGCAVACADALQVGARAASAGAVLHIDPSRRDATGARSWRVDDLRPRWDAVVAVLRAARGGACKLGPGMPWPLPVPAPELAAAELDYVEEHGRLVQAVLWTGSLARCPGARRATLQPEGLTLACREPAVALPPWSGGDPAWLLEPRPALERARLVGALPELRGSGIGELAPGLGVLGARQRLASPWLRPWSVLRVVPLRVRPLRAAVEELRGGEVVVRTRGGSADASALARQLRGRGDRPLVVFALRLGRRAKAYVCAGPEPTPRDLNTPGADCR